MLRLLHIVLYATGRRPTVQDSEAETVILLQTSPPLLVVLSVRDCCSVLLLLVSPGTVDLADFTGRRGSVH